MAGVVGVDVVAAIAAWALEGAVGIGAFVSEVGVGLGDVGAYSEEGTAGVEIASLETGGELVGEGFELADVDDAEAAEVAVFRAERTVNHGNFLDEFGADGFERPEVTLAVALRTLILLDSVEENFETSVDSAVVEIEAEAANFEGFTAAFVLAGVDARVEEIEDLVVAGEEGLVEGLGVAEVDAGFEDFTGDDEGLGV